MVLLLQRVLLLFLLSFFFVSLGRADDSAAMQKLAHSLTPTPPGWTGTNYCDWAGVKCDNSNRVTSINLSKKALSGTLPPQLSTLTQLQSLSLQSNSLSGPIPSLSSISTLQSLYLDSNNFTSLPDGFFAGLTGLTSFSIGSNPGLGPWSIPNDLTQSRGLASFLASDAGIVGSIPDIFTSFPSLTDLRLSYNNLTGPLPRSFGGSGIQNLWINNQLMGLSGSIDVIASMTQLKQVWIHRNAFTGPIPDLSKCEILFDLQLRDNQFTGIVPVSLTTLPGLLNVSLSNNKLQGPNPAFPNNVKVDNTGLNHYCSNVVGAPCDPQVTTLLEVAAGFGYPAKLADAWDGNDACNNWLFVTCDVQKRVVTVNFGKQNFGGVISPAFGNFTYLRNLYLNDNNLTGSIPDGLAQLTQLQTLDVSNNNLSGKVPDFPNLVKFVSAGNPLLGTDVGGGGAGSSSTGKGSGNSTSGGGSSSGSESGGLSVGVIAGVVVSCVVFVAVVLFVVFQYRAKKRRTMSAKVKDPETGNASAGNGANFFTNGNGYGPLSQVQSQEGGNNSDRHFLEGGNVVISIEVLRQVKDNFSEKNILGKGGFGVVYKGELHDGTKIAVKRMGASQIGTKGGNEFQAEIGVLTKVRHRHLVALLGYCINGIERLLVYEYMPQGTLAQHLFEWRDHEWPPLTWMQRVTIALDVARGVEYLHSLAQQSFIHRDLKPSNILLGDDMRAKVADFGLVKLAPDGKYSMETRLAGTFGYLAPEYAATGRVTTKVDVYAFGVILMEIITGRKALDDTVPDKRAHLVAWFRRVLITTENIVKAIDQRLNPDEETLASIYKVAELAGHCTAREPYQRPDMGHAVNVLGPLVEQWRPASQEDEDASGIDLHMSLPECLQRWQANEGTSTMFNDTSCSQTHSSIPVGMVNTFTSSDGR